MNVRAYYFGEDHGAFVDMPVTNYQLHDVSLPNLQCYFSDEDGIIQKEELLILETMVCFALFWVESPEYPVNNDILSVTGQSFKGKMLLFKRRQTGGQFSFLNRRNYDSAVRCIRR